MGTSKINEAARYLTFRLGDELFAVNVFKAREVLDITRTTRIPTAPAYMRGVINVRGNAIPVVDLRMKFGLPVTPETMHTRIIVMELMNEGETLVIGGLADSVHEVVELEPEDIVEPPSMAMAWQTDLILGMGRRNDQFILILDIDKVFMTDEVNSMAQNLDLIASMKDGEGD